jgi:hypothetical protein
VELVAQIASVHRHCQPTVKPPLKSSQVSALMPPAAMGLQEYIAGSSSQSPEASVQGIIVKVDDPKQWRYWLSSGGRGKFEVSGF